MEKQSMPICLTTKEYEQIVKLARKYGMVNASQAIEKILHDIK